jgi:hypothetical protein
VSSTERELGSDEVSSRKTSNADNAVVEDVSLHGITGRFLRGNRLCSRIGDVSLLRLGGRGRIRGARCRWGLAVTLGRGRIALARFSRLNWTVDWGRSGFLGDRIAGGRGDLARGRLNDGAEVQLVDEATCPLSVTF